ncbi:MAG: esterase-like activity of phytase family protein [Cyanobium sp.]
MIRGDSTVRHFLWALGLSSAATLLPAQAAPQFVNGLTIPGTTLDASGGTTVNNGRMGFFSDLYYDPNRNNWWGLSDRGPGGGTISYDTRVNRFTLNVDPTTGAISGFNVVETVLFRDGASKFNGLAPNPSNTLGFSFDPEGFVVLGKSGHFLVSDEYAPRLIEFAPNGQFLRQYEVPANVVPQVTAGVNYTATAKDAPNLIAGRENNRGLEGLAISPDGKYAYAMLQNGLITDGTNPGTSSFVRSPYTRILKYDTSSGLNVAQYAYKLDDVSNSRGISALVALDNSRFLVLERNNRGVGVDGNIGTPWSKKVYQIDLTNANDVTGKNLNSDAPPGVTPVTKTAAALIDLAGNTAAASLEALGNKAPEKWEGLTVGPQLSDGSYVLIAGTDNDYSVTQNGSNVQFDVYYDPTTGNRAQCDLGTKSNCIKINSNGSPDLSTPVTLTANYALIPGVLQAYKATTSDLGGGYVTPTPGPLPLFGAAATLAWSRRLRQRIRGAA